MLNASTVAMPCTVETVAQTKQAQEKFINADQIGNDRVLVDPPLIRLFNQDLNL
jgi:hypothetical protein